MRDQGRLVEWFDDKGYGFSEPNDMYKERVFIQIKDFARTEGQSEITAQHIDAIRWMNGQAPSARRIHG